MVELQYFGHSFFKIKDKKETLLIDPVLSFKAVKEKDLDNVSLVLITNETPGHFDKKTVEKIAKESNAKILAHESILQQLNLNRTQKTPIQANTELTLNGFKVKTTTAHYPQCFYSMGYLIECGGTKIYHAGVTALLDSFSDIKADVVLLPMNKKSMDVVDVVRATKMMKPKTLIPMQYDLFDKGEDPVDLKKRIEESILKTQTVIMTPGKKFKV